MPAKKKTKKKPAGRVMDAPTVVIGETATPKALRPPTVRERLRNMGEQSDRIYNDLKQAQRERDGLLALIAIAEGQHAIRRESDREKGY